MEILTPTGAAMEITELIMPYIGMVLIVVFGLCLKTLLQTEQEVLRLV